MPSTPWVLCGSSYNKAVVAAHETAAWSADTELSTENNVGATVVAATSGLSGGYFTGLADIVAAGFNLASHLPASATIQTVRAKIRLRFPEILEDGEFTYDFTLPCYAVEAANASVAQPTDARAVFSKVAAYGQNWIELDLESLVPTVSFASSDLDALTLSALRNSGWTLRIGSGNPTSSPLSYASIFTTTVSEGGGGREGGDGGGGGDGGDSGGGEEEYGPWVPGPTITTLFELDWVKVQVDYIEAAQISAQASLSQQVDLTGGITKVSTGQARQTQSNLFFQQDLLGQASIINTGQARSLAGVIGQMMDVAGDIDTEGTGVSRSLSSEIQLSVQLSGNSTVEGSVYEVSEVIIIS